MTARYIETLEGYGILFEAEPELVSPRQHFIKECGWTEAEYRKIKNFAWFAARVSAWKDGVELGVAYLGCCSYRTVEEFYTAYRDDYFAQMAREVVDQARAAEARASPETQPT